MGSVKVTPRQLDLQIGHQLVKLSYLDEERDSRKRLIVQLIVDKTALSSQTYTTDLENLREQVLQIDNHRNVVIKELDRLNEVRSQLVGGTQVYSQVKVSNQ